MAVSLSLWEFSLDILFLWFPSRSSDSFSGVYIYNMFLVASGTENVGKLYGLLQILQKLYPYINRKWAHWLCFAAMWFMVAVGLLWILRWFSALILLPFFKAMKYNLCIEKYKHTVWRVTCEHFYQETTPTAQPTSKILTYFMSRKGCQWVYASGGLYTFINQSKQLLKYPSLYNKLEYIYIVMILNNWKQVKFYFMCFSILLVDL